MTCPICLDEYNIRSMTIKCNHTFCVDCLLEHISKSSNNKNNCPLCRSEYFSEIIHKKTNTIPRRYINRELYLYQQHLIQQINNNSERTCRIKSNLVCSCLNKTIKMIKNIFST